MTKKKSPVAKTPAEPQPEPAPAQQDSDQRVEETPFEAVASVCSVLVVGLFILTFLVQNFVIPSGSMENTLLVGDHLAVDRITLSPPTKWMPLVRYREPRRNDIVVFIKPVASLQGQYLMLVKRLIGLPGDRIHIRNGIVIINGVAQDQPHAEATTPENHTDFLDEFPSVPPYATADPGLGTPESWAVEFPSRIQNGDLVVPPGKYFMMGDNRHDSLDSRYWGFVPRENIVGRPLFNYWSFETPDDAYSKTSFGDRIAWMGHVALHFFSDTRWKRTFFRVR
jgi:signal peptidase I